MELQGKVVVITGGASGLGESCARLFTDNGAKVAILDLSRDKGEKLAHELGGIFCHTNVCDEKGMQAAICETVNTFGAIHVAVSCAGMGILSPILSKDGPLSIKDFKLVVDVNLIGTVNLVRLAAEQMIKNDPNPDGERGVVINTASTAAFEGTIGMAAYTASKAAVVAMTLPIAREFAGYGIRVVTIAPGTFDTPLFYMAPDAVRKSWQEQTLFPQRLGKPNEFARMALHIVENTMLNAETIRLDAGARSANH
jgi:NAD(P)-dependent dehydrogenase (short-subunit alcohol dehydrogenase family)